MPRMMQEFYDGSRHVSLGQTRVRLPKMNRRAQIEEEPTNWARRLAHPGALQQPNASMLPQSIEGAIPSASSWAVSRGGCSKVILGDSRGNSRLLDISHNEVSWASKSSHPVPSSLDCDRQGENDSGAGLQIIGSFSVQYCCRQVAGRMPTTDDAIDIAIHRGDRFVQCDGRNGCCGIGPHAGNV